MSQEIINVGASANDGQGDPIRTAFIKTNNNFTELFGIGASQIIYNGTSNVNIPFLNGNVFISVGGVGNVMVLDPTGANIDGTLEVTGDVTGANLLTGGVVSATGTITGANLIGSYIQGIVTTASQTQITELGTLTSLSVSGNIGSGNMLATGDVSITGNLTVNGNATLSGNILGDRVQNGTTSFDIQTQNGNANITVAGTSNVAVFSTTGVYVTGLISANGNVTANNGMFTNIVNVASHTGGIVSVTGNVTANNGMFTNIVNTASFTGAVVSVTGNVTANNGMFTNIVNVASFTGAVVSVTANVTANNGMFTNIVNVSSHTGAVVSVTGNITGAYILGNGSQLTSLPAPTVTPDITSTGDMSIMTYDGVIKSVNYATIEPSTGDIKSAGTISATGNITAGNIKTSGMFSASGNIIANNIGNIAAINLDGNASTVLYGNGVFAPVAGGNSSYGDSNVTTLLSNLGSNTISTTANVTGNYFIGNGSQLTGISGGGSSDNIVNGTSNVTVVSSGGNVSIGIGGTSNVAVFATTGEYVTGLISATGNILSGGTISAVGGLLAGANVFAGNLKTSGFASATGNVIAGNILTGGLISATGNIAGNYFIGNGSQLTGLASSYGDSNVTTLLSNLGSNTISTTANVTGNYFIGNGSQLTGITASANTGNVTFDDQIVIGTGSNDGTGGLYLAPGNASIANSAVQYLRVRGGDVATHIHLDTGNNQYYDQYFGDDSKYVKLVNTGNVEIGIDNAGNTYSWTFGTDGNLTLPGNLVIAGNTSVFGTDAALLQTTDDKPLIAISSGANGAVSSLWVEDIGNVGTSNIAAVYANPTPGSGIVRIAVGQNGNAGPNLWDFDATGNLTLPAAGAIGTDANMVLTTNLANVGNTKSWTFDSDGVITLPGSGFLGNIFGVTALESGGAGAALIQNANCYVGVAPDESFTVVAASQTWTFSNANAAATLQCPVVAYAALPSATYAAGLRAFVNDSTVVAFGDTVAGGASNNVPVWSDGTVWRVG